MNSSNNSHISWDDFTKVELRAGTVIEAEVFKEARRPALKLLIDFGSEIGLKKSSAQITDLYDPELLIDWPAEDPQLSPKDLQGTILKRCEVFD